MKIILFLIFLMDILLFIDLIAPYRMQNFIYRHTTIVFVSILKIFKECTPCILFISFISLVCFNMLELDDSLIDISDTTSAYMFILTILMTFSIDMTFGQYRSKDIRDAESQYYLGVHEISFFCNSYFSIHRFIKTDLFYFFLIYVIIFPCIGYTNYLNKYRFFRKLGISIWQSISLSIILIIMMLIISDFSVSKYSKSINSNSTNIKNKIEDNIKFNMQETLEHDYWLKRTDSKFIQYIQKMYNESSTSSRKLLISFSIDIFFGNLTRFWKKRKRECPYIINLTKKYMDFINKYNFNFPKDKANIFIDKYIQLLGYFYKKYSDNKIVPKFIFNQIYKEYVIPKFIYKILLFNKNNKYELYQQWDRFCKDVFNSNLVSYILTNKPKNSDNIKNYAIKDFEYKSHMYKDVDRKFIQYNLKETINDIICCISVNEISEHDVNYRISNLRNMAPRFFKYYMKVLIKSKHLTRYALNGSKTYEYIMKKYS